MRYKSINNNLFTSNRTRLYPLLKSNSAVLISSNAEVVRSGDQTYPFKQNVDLFYFTGIDQERSSLVLIPEHPNPIYREILFIRKPNEHTAIWEGKKLSIEEAKSISGIATVYWAEDFEKIISSLLFEVEHIYLNSNENHRSDIFSINGESLFTNHITSLYPLHRFERLAPIMAKLRVTKSSLEIDLVQEACNITHKAFERVLKFVRPNVYEYEIEAEIIHEFIKHGATGHAYEPIIASGANACILHYNQNQHICRDGDLILMDFGAEYANYNADLTRTIPVNGRFTSRQKAVYDAVLKIMNHAKDFLVYNNTFESYHKEVGKIVEYELLQLGLLDRHDIEKQTVSSPAYRRYFMHGISHHLGLDVHDVGTRQGIIQKGMLLTCEPGIYIPEENLGIRLENNILISENGNIDLTKNIPLETVQIEDLMN